MPPEVKVLRVDRDVFQQTLEKKLADLPILPSIVAKIIETANNPNATAGEMQRLIVMDQGLASKILRIVNSAYYGFPKRISTVSQAVMILGFSTVRNLVMGVSAFGMLAQKSMPYGLDRSKFWEHCAATAVSGSLLAKHRLPHNRNAPEEAFLGGLMHDVGSLFLDSYFPVQYAVAMAFAAREGKSAREAESLVLGIDHVMIGKRIAEHWNFPPHTMTMIGLHHDPNASHEHFEMIAIIHAADWLAWQCEHPSSEHTNAPVLNREVDDWLLFEESDWNKIKDELHSQYQQCEQLVKMVQ